jgi:lysophospholipase L1-like esterase
VTRRASERRWVLQAVLLGGIAQLVTDGVLYTQNTLHRNGRWQSAKVDLEFGVIGAVATVVTRVPLSGNRLDLGAYLGFQELWLRESGRVRELAFAFRVDEPSYLDVLFGESRARFEGFRLSLHPDFESQRFEALEGEFLESEPLPLRARLETGRWIRVRASFGAEAVELTVDGEPAASFPATVASVRALGFRGSLGGPLLDDVEVGFEDGSSLVETFVNRRRFGPILAGVTAGLVALAALGYRLLRSVAGMDARRAQLSCLTGSLVILLGVAMFTTVDRLHLSRLYPTDFRALNAEGYPNRMERPSNTVRRIGRVVDSLPHDDSPRILLIGSSQTWGAGARRYRDTWAHVLEQGLAARGYDAVVINAGITGAQATRLLGLFQRTWHRAEPDLIVIDLGHNDRADPAFGQALAGFAGESRRRSIPLVFVLEPNSTEAPSEVEERHRIMRRVAAEHGIPVIDMHAHLEEQRETGHIWWDRVHLTSYGQRLFGEELTRQLEPYLDCAPDG